MRIRRKKHLKERLSLVSDYVIVPERDIVNVNEAVKNKKFLDYFALFGNDNPVELEVGCGKGGFIIEKAKLNPDKNFLAVELLDNIIVMAAERAKEENLKNVKFINSGAEYLPRYVKDNSVDNIYLNFSPPYPQKGYETRRLTSSRFIDAYKGFLKDGGSIYQKTDDYEFFIYSKEKFIEHDFCVKDVSDLINSGSMDNVKTEYEKKFLAVGMKIYGLIAEKK